ncbi:class I SAM-dependent methyltransferase [Candidatus Parcubacteria bacterium]|jgi:ubiquinone/menaquinone biosynthesis C-methylase UbiE|nr:class I SAM-dependent methyltransferase [Candidatus Parcubacteria bacterium]MBT7228936.1 class I SAM-dependent methyltransferase [Candidatus Parcubacteria bacterium]
MNNKYSKKSTAQREYYDRTASEYDQWHVETPSAKIVDAWNFENLKKFLKHKKTDKVLDLGCGTGRLSNSLLQISDEVYGVDQSEEVLKIARQKYPQLKLDCSEVINLSYEDNFFDMVIINGSLHHFFAVEQTFAEAHRVLKPGGAFVMLGEPNATFLKFYNPFFYLWIINRIFSKIFHLFTKEKPVPSHLIEPDAESYIPIQLKDQLVRANFEIIDFYTYDYFARSENKFWQTRYKIHLNLERKTLSKIFPYLGAAIQSFAIKK